MSKATTGDREYRLDLRGTNGRVTFRIMVRDPGSKFVLADEEFTADQVRHLSLFARVATAIKKEAAPPFDRDGILREVNSAPHKKRSARKGRGPRSLKDTWADLAK